jgi:hypothetical protein
MYKGITELLKPFPQKRPTIGDAINFVNSKNNTPLSVWTKGSPQPSPPASPGTPVQVSEDTIRERIAYVVDVVLEDLVTFGEGLPPTSREAKQEIGKSIYRPLLNGIPSDRILAILSKVIGEKLNGLSAGGATAKTSFKKSDKKVLIAGKQRCIYYAGRKEYVKMNGTMVPMSDLVNKKKQNKRSNTCI